MSPLNCIIIGVILISSGFIEIESFSKQYIGCFKDSNNARAMNVTVGQRYDNTNSIQFCTGQCSSRSFSYSGAQYGKECFCGESYHKYGQLDNSKCNILCPGNRSEKCGGENALSVYHSCPPGKYGPNCSKDCDCENGTCSFHSGTCRECGWTGSTSSLIRVGSSTTSTTSTTSTKSQQPTYSGSDSDSMTSFEMDSSRIGSSTKSTTSTTSTKSQQPTYSGNDSTTPSNVAISMTSFEQDNNHSDVCTETCGIYVKFCFIFNDSSYECYCQNGNNVTNNTCSPETDWIFFVVVVGSPVLFVVVVLAIVIVVTCYRRSPQKGSKKDFDSNRKMVATLITAEIVKKSKGPKRVIPDPEDCEQRNQSGLNNSKTFHDEIMTKSKKIAIPDCEVSEEKENTKPGRVKIKEKNKTKTKKCLIPNPEDCDERKPPELTNNKTLHNEIMTKSKKNAIPDDDVCEEKENAKHNKKEKTKEKNKTKTKKCIIPNPEDFDEEKQSELINNKTLHDDIMTESKAIIISNSDVCEQKENAKHSKEKTKEKNKTKSKKCIIPNPEKDEEKKHLELSKKPDKKSKRKPEKCAIPDPEDCEKIEQPDIPRATNIYEIKRETKRCAISVPKDCEEKRHSWLRFKRKTKKCAISDPTDSEKKEQSERNKKTNIYEFTSIPDNRTEEETEETEYAGLNSTPGDDDEGDVYTALEAGAYANTAPPSYRPNRR